MKKKKSLTYPGFSFGEAAEAALEARNHAITVLLVDDQPMVAEAIKEMLSNEKGIDFHFCQNPSKAIEKADKIKPTVILQDLVMPNVDGLTMVKFFRANQNTKDVPMIVLSSREEADIKSKAFSLGANDYMVKLPDKLEVIARIRYHSNAYINLIERNQAYEALVASQEALKTELYEAERYVTSLLPEKLDTQEMKTDWVYTSSTDLGGDAFGYHWIDETHFSIYLLDVCGHGVGAALLSVSAMNVLRSQSLVGVDFTNPKSVLSRMNDTFDMEKQNQMYFTMWYGVYNKSSHLLTYAGAGHPPAVLIRDQKPIKLETPNMVIGAMPGIKFKSEEIKIQQKDKLYIFSDGVYEIQYANKDTMMTLDEFAQELTTPPSSTSKVKAMVEFSCNVQASNKFDDDYSLVEIVFK